MHTLLSGTCIPKCNKSFLCIFWAYYLKHLHLVLVFKCLATPTADVVEVPLLCSISAVFEDLHAVLIQEAPLFLPKSTCLLCVWGERVYGCSVMVMRAAHEGILKSDPIRPCQWL